MTEPMPNGAAIHLLIGAAMLAFFVGMLRRNEVSVFAEMMAMFAAILFLGEFIWRIR